MNYKGAVSPIDKPTTEMTKRDGRKYLEWYLYIIPERLAYQSQICGIDLDYRDDSLLLIWRWFLRHVETVENSLEKMNMMRTVMIRDGAHPALADYILSKRQRSFLPGSDEMIFDISIYLGEVCRKRSDKVGWDFMDKGDCQQKKQIVLYGFEDTRVDPPWQFTYNPKMNVNALALKVLGYEEDESDLLGLFRKMERRMKK